jgi:hypothetical protein
LSWLNINAAVTCSVQLSRMQLIESFQFEVGQPDPIYHPLYVTAHVEKR